MTEEEAIEIAKCTAEKLGWLWKSSVIAVRKRKFLFGRYYWTIISNSESKGLNVIIRIDDTTGKILQSNFSRR